MKAALIGLGMVAETHVRAIADIPGLTLAGVCGRDLGKAQAFAAKCAPYVGETPAVFTSVDQIAADESIDFVILCTPPNARLEIVKMLVAAAKPILMEKPIERDTAAAQEIVALCQATQVPLGIVFQHRMRESAQRLRELLAGGTLGPVAVAEIKVPWWREQTYYDAPGRGTYERDGGGVLISQAIHTLDLALSLLGPVAKVQAAVRTTRLHKMEAEDYVTAGLDFTSGVVGSLVASTSSFPGSAESITLHCANASVALMSGELQITWRDGTSETLGTAASTGGGADPMAFTHAWHQAIIADFMAAITDNRPPVASGQDALTVHQLIDAIVQSSQEEHAITLSKEI